MPATKCAAHFDTVFSHEPDITPSDYGGFEPDIVNKIDPPFYHCDYYEVYDISWSELTQLLRQYSYHKIPKCIPVCEYGLNRFGAEINEDTIIQSR